MDVQSQVQRRRGRGVGPLLQEILASQPNEEYYTEEHYRRLIHYEASHLDRSYRTERCVDVHGPNCSLGCRSCHSCRQKTIGRKTECGCGRGTGFWCGSCLSTRMGQNIDEVFRMPDWKCPSCLEICNCSGRTCDRHMAGLGCTRILSGEARDQGYKSTAHYLIQTHLEMKFGIAPALNAGRFQVGSTSRRDGGPLSKRPRLERLNIQSLKAVVEEELPPPKLGLSATSAEHAAFQMTELWMSLPTATEIPTQTQKNLRSAPSVMRPADTWNVQAPNPNVLSNLPAWMSSRPASQIPSGPHPVPPSSSSLGKHENTTAMDRPSLAALFGFPADAKQQDASSSEIDKAEGTHIEDCMSPKRCRPAYNLEEGDQAGNQNSEAINGPHQGLDSGGSQPSLLYHRHARSDTRQDSRDNREYRSNGIGQQLGHAAQQSPQAGLAGSAAQTSLYRGSTAQHGVGGEGPLPNADAGLERLRSTPANPLGLYIPKSEGMFGSLVKVALEYYNPAYQDDSEEKQAAMEAIDMCMEEMQLHFMSPVGISGYNKDFEVQLKSEDDRPQHDMRDHDCLKDACHLLLIAVDASAANYEKAFRLLSSEDPFVDFSRTDPRGRAIILKTAFALYGLMTTTSSSQALINTLVKFVSACLECLVAENEKLSELGTVDTIDLGPLKIGPAKLLDQQRQLQEDVQAVQQANDLLVQLLIGHIQEASSSRRPGTEQFLQDDLLSLIAKREVSEDVRFRVCCLLTIYLVSAGPDQGSQVDELELWDRQHKVAERLRKAGVEDLLQRLVGKGKEKQIGQAWGFANEATTSDPDTIHTCPKVDAVKEKLLARVLGLFVSVGQKSWSEMVHLAIKPYSSIQQFGAQASIHDRQQACIFLAIGLQAAPNCLSRSDILLISKLWILLSFDSNRHAWTVFSFITKALAALPAMKFLFVGCDLNAIGQGGTAASLCKAGLMTQLLTRLQETGAQALELLDEVPIHIQRLAAVIPKQELASWEADSSKLAVAICTVLLPLPHAVGLICRMLTAFSKWLRSAADTQAQAYSTSQGHFSDGGFAAFEETPVTAELMTQQRHTAQETCLAALGGALKVLAVIHDSMGAAAWQQYRQGLTNVKMLLSPALGVPSGRYIKPKLHGVSQAGNPVDRILAELVAHALAACGSSLFLHHILGTFIPVGLMRSEHSAVNTVRLLTEVFQQPNIRQSGPQLQLLLPQLFVPLLDALHPNSQTDRSSQVQVAIMSFFTSLVQVNGSVIVPQTSALPLPSRNTAEDFKIFQRGQSPSKERYDAALQTLIRLCLCHCLNSVDFSLKGRLSGDEAMNGTSNEHVLCALTKEDIKAAKAQLSLLLGVGRPLETVKTICLDVGTQKLNPVPPDFYLRQAEQSMSFILALIQSGKNGADWGKLGCQALKPFMIAPKGTDDLRQLYQSCVDALKSSGSEGIAELELPQEGIATSFEEMSSTLLQASSGRHSRYEPTRRSPLADLGEAQSQNSSQGRQITPKQSELSTSSAGQENLRPADRIANRPQPMALLERKLLDKVEGFSCGVKDTTKGKVLTLRDVTFRLKPSDRMTPLSRHAHVLFKSMVPDLSQFSLANSTRSHSEHRKAVLRNVTFGRTSPKDPSISILVYKDSTSENKQIRPSLQLRSPAIRIDEVEIKEEPLTLPATLPILASTQPHLSTVTAGIDNSPLRDEDRRLPQVRSSWEAGPPAEKPRASSSISESEKMKLLEDLVEMQINSDLGANARALKAALSQPFTTREAVLSRAVAFLLP